MITGELQEVITRDINRKTIKKFHLVLPQKICMKVATKNKKEYNLPHVKHIEIDVINSNQDELMEYVGVKLSVRGTHKTAKYSGADARLEQTRVLGAFDPRNGSFHKWKKLKKRLAKIKSRNNTSDDSLSFSDEFEFSRRNEQPRYSLRDKKSIDDLIERENENSRSHTLDSYSVERYDDEEKKEEWPSHLRKKTKPEVEDHFFSNRSRRNEILTFVADEYLQFHQMHPADVSLFYAPVIEYNGDRNISSEIAIRRKFRTSHRRPYQTLRLIENSLKIKKHSAQPDVFHVSFDYVVKDNYRSHARGDKKHVKLTIDLDHDILIKKEFITPRDKQVYFY